MDKAELMQKEIENIRKLPKELKKEIKKSILFNLVVAFIIIIYLCTINILFYKLENNVFEKYMKFFALGIITVTVIMFEIAYRRQSKRICIIGIELLLCSIISLYIPYIYLFANINLKRFTIILPCAIAVYYIAKAIIIYKSREIQYQNNLSDVKEILKNTEKQSYLDEKSSKTYKEMKAFEEKQKEELLKEQKRKAEENKKRNNKKMSNASKNKKTTGVTKNNDVVKDSKVAKNKKK